MDTDSQQALLSQVHGPRAAEAILGALDAVRPELGRDALEAGIAEATSALALDGARQRLANVAVLTALGGGARQLDDQLRDALDAGVAPAAILEEILRVARYAGPARAAEGFAAAHRVFASALAG